MLIERGNHAYFYDRWWTQKAALEWFRYWLDPDGTHTTSEPTVAQTPGGSPMSEQTVDLTGTSREDGDAELRERSFCPAAEESVGPNALLGVTGADAAWTLDGRRSYSGWDDHRVAAWTIDPGDGTTPATGDDVHDALIDHSYDAGGTYDVTLTVTDDTGRTAETTRTIEVSGAPAPAPSPSAPPADDRTGSDQADPGLPATGGSAVLAGTLLLALAAGLSRHRRRTGRGA